MSNLFPMHNMHWRRLQRGQWGRIQWASSAECRRRQRCNRLYRSSAAWSGHTHSDCASWVRLHEYTALPNLRHNSWTARCPCRTHCLSRSYDNRPIHMAVMTIFSKS